MAYSILSFLLVLLHVAPALLATYTSAGCFSQADIGSYLTNLGSYTYQSTGYCQDECASDKVAALLDGKYCYCGLTVPAASLQVSSAKCNVPCQGYSQQTCGGDGYFYVYVNQDVSGSSMAASASTAALLSLRELLSHSSTSSAEPSTLSLASESDLSLGGGASASSTGSGSTSSGSTGSKTSSSSKSSTSTSSPTTTSNSVVTSATTITTDVGGTVSPSVIEITTTVSGASNTSTSAAKSGSSSGSGSGSGSKKSLSSGGIAGVVVGVVAGVALIAAAVFFFLRRRRDDGDDEEFYDDVGGARQHGFDTINANPYMDGTATSAAVAGVGAHGHHNSNTSRSYSSNNEDIFYFDNLNRGGDALRPPDEEHGRRRLSDGSLPDMVQRNPGSLKVVN